MTEIPCGTAVLIFDDDGRFLMQKRGTGCGKGQWSVPGGRQDPGEALYDTAIREAREEVHARIVLLVEILATVGNHKCCGDTWETHFFKVISWFGDPVPTEEAVELFWASWDDLPSPLWPTFEANIPAIRKALERHV